MLIHVHGFDNDLSSAQQNLNSIANSLSQNGYSGQVVGFAWNSDPGSGYFGSASDAANLYAPIFSNFLTETWKLWPSMPIIVTTHSLGARIALGALNAGIAAPPLTYLPCLTHISMLGAAVDNESLERGEEFFPGASSGGSVGGSTPPSLPSIKVWPNDRDNVLDGWYQLRNIDQALGDTGPEHPGRVPGRVGSCWSTRKIIRDGLSPDEHSDYILSKTLVGCVLMQTLIIS